MSSRTKTAKALAELPKRRSGAVFDAQAVQLKEPFGGDDAAEMAFLDSLRVARSYVWGASHPSGCSMPPEVRAKLCAPRTARRMA